MSLSAKFRFVFPSVSGMFRSLSSALQRFPYNCQNADEVVGSRESQEVEEICLLFFFSKEKSTSIR